MGLRELVRRNLRHRGTVCYMLLMQCLDWLLRTEHLTCGELLRILQDYGEYSRIMEYEWYLQIITKTFQAAVYHP